MFSFFRTQIINFFNFLKTLYKLFLFILSKFIDFFNFEFSSLDLFRKNFSDTFLLKHDYYNKNDTRISINSFLFREKSFLYLDIISYLYLSFKYSSSDNKINLFRSYFRALNTKNGFYFNFNSLKDNKTFLDSLKNIFMSGFKSVGLGLRFWLIPLIVGFIIVYYSMVLRCVPFNKIVAFWIIFGMLAYWVLSGFVFFIKKYQYSKFTTAIQRF